jgi:hypothetical protein
MNTTERRQWNAVKQVLNRAEKVYTRFGERMTHHHAPTLKKLNGNVTRIFRVWARHINNNAVGTVTFNQNLNSAVAESGKVRKLLREAYQKVPAARNELNAFNRRASAAQQVISRAAHQALSRPHFVSGTFVGRRARNALNEATGTTRPRSPIRNVHGGKISYYVRFG